MTLATTEWPLRKIIWGIWSISMSAYITHKAIGERKPLDEFDTYEDALKYLTAVWTPKEIQKWKLEPRPKERIAANQYLPEDV